jgi:cysteine desulfurase / selenocysteine lyase
VIGELLPTQVGWMGVENAFDFLDYNLKPLPHAGRFEEGSPNVVGIHALGATAELLLEAGPVAIEREILALTAYLAEGLENLGRTITSPRGKGELSGILTFTHPRADARRIAAELNARRIVCVERAGNVRFSPHFYNDQAEADRALEAVRELLG